VRRWTAGVGRVLVRRVVGAAAAVRRAALVLVLARRGTPAARLPRGFARICPGTRPTSALGLGPHVHHWNSLSLPHRPHLRRDSPTLAGAKPAGPHARSQARTHTRTPQAERCRACQSSYMHIGTDWVLTWGTHWVLTGVLKGLQAERCKACQGADCAHSCGASPIVRDATPRHTQPCAACCTYVPTLDITGRDYRAGHACGVRSCRHGSSQLTSFA
jgi:hypothetical protein